MTDDGDGEEAYVLQLRTDGGACASLREAAAVQHTARDVHADELLPTHTPWDDDANAGAGADDLVSRSLAAVDHPILGQSGSGTQIRFQPRSTSPCVVNFCCVPDLSAASQARIAKIHRCCWAACASMSLGKP